MCADCRSLFTFPVGDIDTENLYRDVGRDMVSTIVKMIMHYKEEKKKYPEWAQKSHRK